MTTKPAPGPVVPPRDALVRDGIPLELRDYFIEEAKRLRAEALRSTFRRVRSLLRFGLGRTVTGVGRGRGRPAAAIGS